MGTGARFFSTLEPDLYAGRSSGGSSAPDRPSVRRSPRRCPPKSNEPSWRISPDAPRHRSVPAALASAGSAQTLDLVGHPVGTAALVIFTLAYLAVMAEEFTKLRKSKPVILAAGLIWA